jgi:photosystem II stability/assembly factor-like uncharacterized protein
MATCSQAEDVLEPAESFISLHLRSRCEVVATRNGGGTWSAQYLPKGIGYLNLYAVSCPTGSDCWAVGNTTSGAAVVVATANGGTTWNGFARVGAGCPRCLVLP